MEVILIRYLSSILSALLLSLALPASLVSQQKLKKAIQLPHHGVDSIQGAGGAFWKIENNYDPILRLKNVVLNHPIDVTPILYFADGTRFELSPMHLEPAGVAQIDIRLAIQSVPASLRSHVSLYGMAGISYRWSWPAVLASVQSTDEIASLTLTSSLKADVNVVHSAAEDSTKRTIEGSWWLPTSNSEGFVGLENASMTTKQVEVLLLDRRGGTIGDRSISVFPHGTELLKLSSMLGQAGSQARMGGVEIRYTGPSHGVLAYEGIEDEVAGYSASPVLSEQQKDPSQPIHMVTLSAPGLMLGKPEPDMLFPSGTSFTPYAVLRNISSHELSLSLSIVSTDDEAGNPIQLSLGQLKLSPTETTQFDFGTQFDAEHPIFKGFGHLVVSFDGQDGYLALEAGSVDQSKSYVFSVTPSQQVESASRTLCFGLWRAATTA